MNALLCIVLLVTLWSVKKELKTDAYFAKEVIIYAKSHSIKYSYTHIMS